MNTLPAPPSKTLRLLALACLGVSTSAFTQTPDSLEPCLQSFAAHNLSQADACSRAYLVRQPHSAPAMFLLGRVLEARDQPVESLEWFTRAAAEAMPSAEDLRLVAMDYVLLNSYPDAHRWLSKSVEMDPRNPETWYDLGRVRMMQGNLPSARAPLERSLALKPRQAKVANNLGIVAEAESAPEQAETLYRQAIAWETAGDRLSEQPYLNLGTLLISKQRSAAAIPLLEKAASLAPADTKIHEQLARAQEQQGNTERALAELELAVKLDPASAHLHYQLGQLYRHTGHPEKAKAELLLSGTLYQQHSSEREH